MIESSKLIKTIKDGTPAEIPARRRNSFRLDALQYWWLHHEDARHQHDQAHIANELANLKWLAISDTDGPFYARLLGCMVLESRRHSRAQEEYRKKTGKIVETWECFPIAELFQELRRIAGQWLLIPCPGGEPKTGNDVPA